MKVVNITEVVVKKAVSSLQAAVAEEVNSSHPYGSHRFNIDMYVSDGMRFEGRHTFSKVDLQETLKSGEVKMTGELRKMVEVVINIYDLSRVFDTEQDWWSPELQDYWIKLQLRFWKERNKEDIEELNKEIKELGFKVVSLKR